MATYNIEIPEYHRLVTAATESGKLRAHVNELRAALAQIAALDYSLAAVNAMGYEAVKLATAALAATPAQSLAKVKAEALREAAKELFPLTPHYIRGLIEAVADRIEKEAGNG